MSIMKTNLKTLLVVSLVILCQVCFSGILFADTTLYNFEIGDQNWTHQTYVDSQACTSVAQTSAESQTGAYSLQMNMSLIGGHANNSKGEAYVDRGEGSEIDLQGVPLNVWTYCPTGSDGNPSNANGIQVFFKDSSWRSWYGPWQSIGDNLTWYDILMDTWTELAVTLGTTTPAYVDAGFDATNVRMIGIKMGTGGGSTATYNGPIYIDEVHTIGADTTPPGPPTGVSVSDPGTGGTLNISWTNPTDTDFAHVHIYRSSSSGTLGSLIADNQTGTSYQNTGLTNGTLYYYTLRSVDSTGNQSTNTDQHSGMPTGASSTHVFYDFEDGTTQSWMLEAASGLANTTTHAQNGTRAIKFNIETSMGLLGLGGQGYVSAYSDEGAYPCKDMEDYDGFSVWIYLEPGISIPDHIDAIPVLYTHPSGFYRGDSTQLNLTSSNLGMWHKLTFDIALDGPISVQHVSRMGVRLEGGGGVSGNADLYIDFMEGVGFHGDITPPGPPTNVIVSNPGTGGTLNLGWTNPTDADFNFVKIYRSTTPGNIGSLIDDLVFGTSFQDTGLANGTQYYYTIHSVDFSQNESTNTDQHSGIPTGGDTTPPAPPTNVNVSNPGTGGTLNLSWTNPGDADFNHIHIYRSTSSGILGSLVNDNITGTNLSDTGLTNGQAYYYTLRSVDDTGNESTNTDQHSGIPTFQDSIPPGPPTGVYVVDAQIGNQLNIYWTNPSDGDFSHIRVYRSTASGVLGSMVYDNIQGVNLADTGLTNGTSYYYTLHSVDGVGNESTNTDQYSGIPSLVTISALFDFEDGTSQGWVQDTSAYFIANLGVPANTTARSNTGNRSLSFPLDFNPKDPTWGTINDVAYVIPASPYNLSTRTGISLYIYIEHTGFQYDAPPCATVYVKTGPNWDWFESKEYVNIPWSFDCGNFRRIPIDFSQAKNSAGQVVPVTNLDDVREIGFHISGASTASGSSTLYLDTVKLEGGGDTTPPSPPTNITVTDTELGGELYITWVNPPDGDFEHVNVYRSTTSGVLGEWIHQAPNGANSYLDIGLTNGTRYYYTLHSVDTSMNESINTDQHSAIPTITSILTLYDFEDGTNQGWVNDTSVDFVNNLGIPSNSTTQAQEGLRSLRYPLNLDIKDPAWGSINDAGYVRPPVTMDLSTAQGIAAYIYVPATANISSSTPALASVYVKTGTLWNWFESDQMAELTLGAWNRITINFSSAQNSVGQTGQSVTNTNSIHEIGIHVSGAATSSGSTYLYLDYVGAVGAQQQDVLSVNISGSVDFGILQLGDEVVSTQALTVTNTGTITETFSLLLLDPSGWRAVQVNPGDETYVLNAMFNTARPLSLSFVESNHALSTIPQQCTTNKFAGDRTGAGVSSAASRLLWFEFRAPTMTSIIDSQTIRLVITVEAS
ncbi:MAG: hypothetical protein ABH868_07750 [bacterium]